MKRQQRLRSQGKLLDEIMRWKRQELSRQKQIVSTANLRALAPFTPPPLDLAAALAAPGVSLIAEVKRASPHKGLLCHDFDPAQLALAYAQGGAAAISCVTDAKFFQGQLEHLTAIKEAFRRQQIALPVLRHDFIFDPYQVLEARAAGADALLLILALLGDAEYRDLLAYTHELGMAAVVEVGDEGELARALHQHPRLIGVTNRDRRNFALDQAATARLRPLIPAGVLVVSMGGIAEPAQAAALRAAGVDAMLVGEGLLKLPPPDRRQKVQALLRAGGQTAGAG